MKYLTSLAPLLALAAALPATAATVAETATPPAASIPFADKNIRDWVTEGDSTVYVQDNSRRWYRATLFAPATELPFVQAIGFDTRPMGRLDRWSTLVIRGQRYALSTFERVDGPPARKGKPVASAKVQA